MKNLYKQKREQGFTIIEVMIVLAIAAVILLIVLLAVPALQRNSRNTQRNNDAASIAAAITTCLANHNGLPASCQAIGPTSVDIDLTKLGQLTTTPVYSVGASTGNTTTANWRFKFSCTADGTADTVAATDRTFSVVWQNETTGAAAPRCVDS